MSVGRSIDQFNRDVAEHGGYVYTTNLRLSSELANRRQTEAALRLVSMAGKRVLDIGCGDGAYTLELLRLGRPAHIHGVDPAAEAVRIASGRDSGGRAEFSCHDACDLPFSDQAFDIAHLRGVLHHMDRPVDALREAFRVAQTVVVIEPNGYNPALKIIERVSPYHIAHDEKSYRPLTLRRWIASVGGSVELEGYAGTVPFFCPDWAARLLKTVEPLAEALPLVRALVCGAYVFRARKVA